MHRKYLLIGLYGLLAIAAFVFLETQFTFGFVPLFLLLALFLALPLVEKRLFSGEKGEDVNWKSIRAFVHTILIAVFGGLALFAFKNYVYPDPSIFRNGDYHALRVDGIELQDPRFVLAGDSRDAFLDNPRFRGRLSVHAADSNGVVLDMDGFSDPVYLVAGGKMRRFSMLQPDAFPSFRAGDTVQFVHRESGVERVMSMCLNEDFRDYPWHDFVSSLFSHRRDSIHYAFISSDGQAQVSSESRFLLSGLPLSSIMSDVIQDFDPKGVQIVRAKYDMDTKTRQIRSYYSDTTNRYYILVDQTATDISEIRINGTRQNLSPRFTSDTLRYGQPFVVGFGKNKSSTLCFNWCDGHLRLEYYLPEYRYLSSSNANAEDQSLMVTTSLFENASRRNEAGLLEAYSDNIALFDQFERPDNVYQMPPWFLSYRSVEAGRPMSFTVHSDATYPGRTTIDRFYSENRGTHVIPGRRSGQIIPTEAYFPGISTSNGRARWLVGAEDFSVTTPFRADRLALLILAVVLLSLMAVYFGREGSSNNAVEYAVFLLVIAFFTVRCFLMWRTTVFPPVSSISFFEFNHFRDESYFHWLLGALCGFYGLVLFFKLGIPRWLGNLSLPWKRRYKPNRHRRARFSFRMDFGTGAMALTMIAAYVLLVAVSSVAPSGIARFANILAPVCLFLLIEYAIYYLYSDPYDDRRNTRSTDLSRSKPVLLSFLNVLLASAYTFYKDGGYGVMFLLFGLYLCAFLVADFRHNTRGRTPVLVVVCWIFLFLVVLSFTLCYKFFFIWVLDHRKVFCIALFVAMCLVFGALSVVMGFDSDLKETWLRVPKWGWSLVTIAICCVCVYFGAGVFIDGKHMEYRTRVHMASPSTILSKNVPDAAAQNRFMQASLNDWILDEYETMGKDVHPLFEKGVGYFKLQPQSKLGAMWFAQSTDILLSRFIIAEHSQWLAVLFIVAFLLLLLVALSHSCLRRESRVILFCIPMLFLVQCTLIWLANTRKFIFFGQDFPLLSTTSNLSSIYFFILMGVLLAISYLETDNTLHSNQVSRRALPEIDKNNERTNSHVRDAFSIAAVAFMIFGGLFQGKNSDPGVEKEPGVYSIDPLLKQTAEVVDSLNKSLFFPYQEDHPLHLASDMSAQLAGFYEMISVPDTGFIDVTRKTNQFAAQMMDRYFRSDSHANSSRKLLHVRNIRSYNEKGEPSDMLKFEMNSLSYYYHLPVKEKRAWTGSVIAQAESPAIGPSYQQTSSAEYFRLDSAWTPDHRPRVLVRAVNGLRLVGESSIVDLSSGALPVGVMSSKDRILQGRTRISTDVIGHQDYFARNVLVNGQRTFLYPYGQRLYWLRDFASQIKLAKESHPDGDAHFSDDVPISLSGDLSRRIYDVFESRRVSSQDKSVVVADGDGMIRAMVDYRSDGEYRLNPNDSKRIYALLEEIYMDGDEGSPREYRYFGSFATSPLRLGPGSSQKPIVWTAVSAGYGGHSGFLSRLELARLESNYLSPLVFPRFAGHPIELPFRSKWGDEGSGERAVTLERYISNSSNYYNAMMAYYGMLTPAQIDALWSDGLFKTPRYRNADEYKAQFPIMNVPGHGRVSFNHFVSVDEYLNHDALLPAGLEAFFDLPSTRRERRKSGLYPSISKMVEEDGETISRPSVFPNLSYFNMDIREGRTGVRQRNEYGVRNVAIGSNSVWFVSPVKMAEMYGRLVTLNQAYELTLDPSHSSRYEPFSVDSSWEDYSESRLPFVYGLSEVFDSQLSGTAWRVYDGRHGDHRFGDFVSLDKAGGRQDGQYYVYGKTGTINAKWNRASTEDHLLAVVITNRRISTVNDLSGVKFYVVYFADYSNNASGGTWINVDAEILLRVMQSEEFVNYMND